MVSTTINAVRLEDIKNIYGNSSVHSTVVTNEQNRIVFVSNSFAAVLGYEPGELMNQEFVLSPGKADGFSFKSGEVSFGESQSEQGFVVQKNGSKALVDYETVSVTDVDAKVYTLSCISNLEAYRQCSHLNTCKQTLENILDNLTASIVVINPALAILETNATFFTAFGLSAGTPDYTLLKDLNCSFWQNEDTLLRLKDNYDQQHFNFDEEFEWEKTTSETVSFKITSRLIHEADAIADYKILLVITDVSEEKANQSGRNQQIRHIMHELRNPLSNLSLCVELLADSTKENNQDDSAMFLAKAGNSIQRMKQLINELNEFKGLPGK